MMTKYGSGKSNDAVYAYSRRKKKIREHLIKFMPKFFQDKLRAKLYKHVYITDSICS